MSSLRFIHALAGAAAGLALLPAASSAADVDWTPCGQRLQCAHVPVPLDWSRPEGRTISLWVTRRPAGRPAERIGSLFVNPGGPGDSGVADVKARGAALDAL